MVSQSSIRSSSTLSKKDGVTITFSDGTSVHAPAVIACDGIKSLCRKIILGKDNRQAEPVFAGEYAYRALLDRELANSILTPELAGNGNIYCGHGAHVRAPKDIHPFALACTCTLPDFIERVSVSDVRFGWLQMDAERRYWNCDYSRSSNIFFLLVLRIYTYS
jgi:2-polyprenyl-6-methoxyphenol hydroxylase-like FAD-dependent oxidoreductase